jgi:hypothetical protein
LHRQVDELRAAAGTEVGFQVREIDRTIPVPSTRAMIDRNRSPISSDESLPSLFLSIRMRRIARSED